MMTMIREARLQKGWTQLDLAKNPVFHNRQFLKLKVGKENTLLIKISKIAEALGIKTEELMKE